MHLRSQELRPGTRNGNDRERRPQIAWNINPVLPGPMFKKAAISQRLGVISC
jgi:hypothetical protein